MSEYLRVIPQMIVGGVMSFVILQSMIGRITLTDLIVLPFMGSLFIGGILALFHKPVSNWLLLFGASGVLIAGTYFHYVRIVFIIHNHSMEGPNGYGSPLAFLLGSTATTITLFFPGLLFTIWNGRKIIHRTQLPKT